MKRNSSVLSIRFSSYQTIFGLQNTKNYYTFDFSFHLTYYIASNLSKVAILTEQPLLELEATAQLAVVASAEEFHLLFFLNIGT